MTSDQVALDTKLHVILAGTLTDKAMDVFCNVEDGHGLEASISKFVCFEEDFGISGNGGQAQRAHAPQIRQMSAPVGV